MTIDVIANEQITARQVRLVDGEQMIGVLSLNEALSRARGRGLDLVLISAGDTPVCKILDMDRWRYERSKQEREIARRQRELTVETKEIQLRPVTDDNDVAIKAKKASKFLADGDKVRVVVRFKGRERSHRAEGYKIMDQFLLLVGEHKIDKPLSDGENDISVILGSMVSKAEKSRKDSK